MDPHSFIARAEAQRWLGIAEKLLIGHDLVGSKTFAIRARESDPRLEAADQILAIADTLLAAEKRVVGNNGTQQPDFYAILQLVQFDQDTDRITAQYRQLAFVLNPNQNRFPYSDQAFQLVNDAWAVLSNPMRKSMYDSELDDFPQQQQQMNTMGFNLEQQHHNQQQQQQQHNFFSINHMATNHEQELPEPQQIFETRAQRTHQQQQLQQHNFLSQNSGRAVPVCEQEQLFQHPEQVRSPPQQQARPSPQPPHLQPPTPPPPAAPPQPPLYWPQAPPPQQQQFQHEQHQQQQQLHQEHHQQQWLEQNDDPVQLPSEINSNNRGTEPEPEPEPESEPEPGPETATADDNMDNSPTFWTACPYCFYMYEHYRIYADCTLRCVTCKRAFQAVPISSPPSIVEGQDAYFYCFGFFPLAISMSHLVKNNNTLSNWIPFSPLYDVSSNVQNHLNDMAAPKKKLFMNRNLGPRIYIDDESDGIFTGISEPSDDSDLEWNSTKKKLKRTKKAVKV